MAMKRMISYLSAVLISMIFLVSCGEPKVTVESVIEQLKESGLPIEYSIVYTSENDPNGSDKQAYLQKGNFADSTFESEYSKEEPLSGSVEIFSSKEKAIERADYLTGYGILNDFDYQIINDCILLRLNSKCDHAVVEHYANAIGGEIYTQPDEESIWDMEGNLKDDVPESESEESDYFLDVENPYIVDALINPEKYVDRKIVLEVKLTSDVIEKDGYYLFEAHPTRSDLDFYNIMLASVDDHSWKMGEIHAITGTVVGDVGGTLPMMLIRQLSVSDTKGD